MSLYPSLSEETHLNPEGVTLRSKLKKKLRSMIVFWKRCNLKAKSLLGFLSVLTAISIVNFIGMCMIPKSIGNNQDLMKLKEDMVHLKNESSELKRENFHLKNETMEINQEILDIRTENQKLRNEFAKENLRLKNETMEINQEILDIRAENQKLRKEFAKENLRLKNETLEINQEILDVKTENQKLQDKFARDHEEIEEIKSKIGENSNAHRLLPLTSKDEKLHCKIVLFYLVFVYFVV